MRFLLLQLVILLGCMLPTGHGDALSSNDYVSSVPLNANCSIFDDIQSVKHHIPDRQVIIELNGIRRCDDPSFLVRLSGTALYKLRLSSHSGSTEPRYINRVKDFLYPSSNVYTFSYPAIVDEGLYFLEIIVLYCNRFESTSYQFLCLESVHNARNVVNAAYSVYLSPTNVTEAASTGSMRWKFFSKKHKPMLLHTRYQTMDCGGYYCDPSDHEVRRHGMYSWVDGPDWVAPYRRVMSWSANLSTSSDDSTIDEALPLMVRTNKTMTVCFIGDSHSRGLTLAALALPGRDANIYFRWIESKFPGKFNADDVKAQRCSYSLFGYGQWPLSYYQKNAPYSADQMYKETAGLMKRLLTARVDRAYFHSCNYNSLGAIVTSCPPMDFRSPPAVDMVNRALRDAAKKHHIPYIDLSDIVGPLWDSAVDYCHYYGKVFNAEAEFLLYSIFNRTQPHEGVVLLTERKFLKDLHLFRFSSGSTVYVSKDGVLRPFPNGDVFTAMGFDFSRVRILSDADMGEYVVGRELSTSQPWY